MATENQSDFFIPSKKENLKKYEAQNGNVLGAFQIHEIQQRQGFVIITDKTGLNYAHMDVKKLLSLGYGNLEQANSNLANWWVICLDFDRQRLALFTNEEFENNFKRKFV